MTLNKIYILCPGNVISGGIYSLHNLCAKLIEAGFHAGIHYHNIIPGVINHDHIRSYNVPSFESIVDTSDNIIIVSETETLFLHPFLYIRKMVYWLGLNNYFKKPPFRRPFTIKTFRKFIQCRNYYGYSAGMVEDIKRNISWWVKARDIIWQDNTIHMSNSHYVAECCKKRGIKKIYVLHNPVREEYYLEAKHEVLKKTKIIVGPKTPKILILLCRLYFRYEVVRLKHLSPHTVKQHMKEAMVFAEFGNNSGRDRMPREAALMGCVVLSNTRGSASVYSDMPFPSTFKIADSITNYPKIIKLLKYSIENYSSVIVDFQEYVHRLEEERMNFPANVKSIFSEVMQ
jgi:hypothetical protein